MGAPPRSSLADIGLRRKLLVVEDIPPEALRGGDLKTIIPPLYGALVKNEQDVHQFERLVFMARGNN